MKTEPPTRDRAWPGKLGAAEIDTKQRLSSERGVAAQPNQVIARLKNLNSKPDNLACISSEGRGIVDVLCGKYSNGYSDEDFFLAGYSGDQIKVNRITRASIWLPNPCLVVYWMLQPDKVVAMLVKTNLTESGLLQRFLLHNTQAEPPAFAWSKWTGIGGVSRATERRQGAGASPDDYLKPGSKRPIGKPD